MKALVCEMCNSSDLVKQDGNFVCQSCGMKYTLEEAKKMMVEGTVKVDNAEFVQKYLQNARRAKQKEDWEETEKYYNMVEQNDPSNIEAIFYSAYGKARACLSVNEIFKREAIYKALINSISIIDDNYEEEHSKAAESVIEQIVTDVIGLYGASFVYTQTKTQYGTTDDKDKTYTLFIRVSNEMDKTLENIYNKLTKKETKLFIAKQQLRLMEYMCFKNPHLSAGNNMAWAQDAIRKVNQVKEMEPSYTGRDFQAFLDQTIKASNRKNTITGIVALVIIAAAIALVGFAIYSIVA